MNFLFLFTLVLTNRITARPVEQENKDVHDHVKRLHRDFNLAAYVESFKNIMANYVSSEYRHLTTNEYDEVKKTLEEFLRNFGEDLKGIMNGDEDKFEVHEKIEDGISDDTFEEIKSKVKNEFTEASNEKTNEIVYRLRKNLLWTRQKLDQIIEESKRAHIENS